MQGFGRAFDKSQSNQMFPKVFGRTTPKPSLSPSTPRASSTTPDQAQPIARDTSEPALPSSVSQQRPISSRTTSSRPLSRSPEKKSSLKSDKKSSLSRSPKKKDRAHDPDTHPLNYPPEERARLYRLSVRMDQEKQQTNGNGTAADKPTQNGEAAPAPPPHKTPTTPPPVSTEDAEAFKAAGNKYFKAGDYTKAIAEYTKG
jgi:DnaJ family protein C protein 7